MKGITFLLIILLFLNCNEAGAPIRNKRAACKATGYDSEFCTYGLRAYAVSSKPSENFINSILAMCAIGSLEERKCNKESINLPEFFP